jgi:hypothetical protein
MGISPSPKDVLFYALIITLDEFVVKINFMWRIQLYKITDVNGLSVFYLS